MSQTPSDEPANDETAYEPDDFDTAAEDVDGISDALDADGMADGEAVGIDDVLVLEEVDNELVLPVWEATGEPRVDAALDLLVTLDDDVHQHAAVFDEVHQQLRAALSDIDASSS